MLFSEFTRLLPRINQVPLPGEAAHERMSPPERRGLMQTLDFSKNQPKQAAVMMLCYPRNEQTMLLLIIRNTYPGVHSSQIAFPGGKREPEDSSFLDTALRETWEEVGIDMQQIEVVRAFSQVYIPPSNFLVHPYLGICRQQPVLNPSPDEVSGIIEMPLDHFLDETNVVDFEMATSYSVAISVPVFAFAGHQVWGATAMMMSELKEVLKSVL